MSAGLEAHGVRGFPPSSDELYAKMPEATWSTTTSLATQEVGASLLRAAVNLAASPENTRNVERTILVKLGTVVNQTCRFKTEVSQDFLEH